MNIIKKLVLGSALVLGTTTVSTALDEIAVPFLNYNTAGTSVQVTTTSVDVKVEFINILAPSEAYDSQEFTNVHPNSYGVVSVNFRGTLPAGGTETPYEGFNIANIKTATENYMFRISTRTANTTGEYKVVSYVSVFDQVLRNMASVGNAAEGAEVTNGSVTPAKINPGTAGQILTTLAGATAWTNPENITVGKATTASQIITTGNNSEKVLLGAVTEGVPATWGQITSAHVSAVEGDRIAGSKITPDFGAQNVVTTGKLIGANLEIGTLGTAEVRADENGIKYVSATAEVGMGTFGTDDVLVITKGATAPTAGVIKRTDDNPILFTSPNGGSIKNFTADVEGNVTAKSLNVTGTVNLPNGSIENADLATGIAPSKITKGGAGQVLMSTALATEWKNLGVTDIAKPTVDNSVFLGNTTGNSWGKITNVEVSTPEGTYTGIDVAKIKLAGPINAFDFPTPNSVYLTQGTQAPFTGAFAQITDDYVAPKVEGSYNGIASQKINFTEGTNGNTTFGTSNRNVNISTYNAAAPGDVPTTLLAIDQNTASPNAQTALIASTFRTAPAGGSYQAGLEVMSNFSTDEVTIARLGSRVTDANSNTPTALYLASDADAIYVEAGKSTLKATTFTTGDADDLVTGGTVSASFYIIAGDKVLPPGTDGQIVYLHASASGNVDLDDTNGTETQAMPLNATMAFIYLTNRWYKLD